MEERLQILMANESQISEPQEGGSTVRNDVTRPGGVPAPGWKLLDDHSNWSPCPIGVYYLNPNGM